MQEKQITFVGLGRMGSAMAMRLAEKGYSVYGYDENKDAELFSENIPNIHTYATLREAVAAQEISPKVVWLMVPSQYVDNVLTELVPLLQPGDTIIDGGNSFFKNTLVRADMLAEKKINFIDCGTSGGVSGARNGASLMVGGENEVVEKYADIFTSLAVQNGYAHVGGIGSGHFTKMVHNGIEYGMMGAIAEGINILNEHKEGLEIDVMQALKPYEHGSIIQGSLMTWMSEAFNTENYLDKIAGEVPKGETEMEMEYLIQHENVLVLEAALLQRKQTRTTPSFIGTLISAMRNQFGGHKILTKD
jgi:6-phosphogluconate dehydrogenase